MKNVGKINEKNCYGKMKFFKNENIDAQNILGGSRENFLDPVHPSNIGPTYFSYYFITATYAVDGRATEKSYLGKHSPRISR